MQIEWKETSNEVDNDAGITTLIGTFGTTQEHLNLNFQLILNFSEHGGRDRRDALDSVDRYDREDPCKGMKQILTGFSKWSDRYISECSGQRTMKHQKNRMIKWGGIMNSVMGYNFPELI